MIGQPDISVVVPFFNSEQHFSSCIVSLVEQDFDGEAEIILVDNGSTDGSAGIAARHPDLVVLEESTPGAYAARNTGIRRAQAPVIAFTDADCVVERRWLQSILDGLADPKAAIVIGQCRYPREASTALKILSAYENAKAEYVINRCPPTHHFGYTNNMAVRADLFSEIGLFEQWDRAADSEFIHRMANNRPDLRTVFLGSMRITHLEFLRARDRLRRLSLYTDTNAKIPTFRELGGMYRLAVLTRMFRTRWFAE